MNAPTGNGISGLAWALLLALGLLWGGSFFFARVAVAEVPPFTLALSRFALAALCLHLFIAGRYGIYREIRTHWRQFLLLGLINNAIPHSLIFLGQTQIGAGLASILNASTPIWTVLIAHALTADEKLNVAKAAGTLTGLAGTAILFAPHLMATADAPLWALLLPVGAAIAYGFAAIYSRRFRGIAAPVTAAGQLTASTLIMLPVSLVIDRPWTLVWPRAESLGAILGLAVFSTALAYILFFRLIRVAGATNASLVTLLVPASAILLGVVFLGERLGAYEWVGLFIIALGLLILDGRLMPRRLAARD